jgi:hypothetical protein
MFSRLPISTALVAICLATVAVMAARAADTEKETQRHVYQIADLVISPALFPDEPARKKGPATTNEDSLIKQIMENVEPASWSQRGGCGTIEYFAPTMSLIVNQTPEIQAKVAAMLVKLRKLADIQVVVETRLVFVSDECAERLDALTTGKPAVIRTIGADGLERIGVDFEAANPSENTASAPARDCAQVQVPRFLNDKQLYQFLERVGDDTKSNVLMPPRWTLLNKETKTETLIEGGALVFGYTVRPVVSADHRFIQVALKVEQKDVTPAVCETTVVVPDGGTVLLGGFQATREVEKECPLPVVGYIPYVNRLFKVVETSSEPRRGFMLVTARIVGQPQQQEKSGQATAVCPRCQEEPRWQAAASDPSARQAKVVAELLRAYDTACDEGRADEADKFARAALILDPTCFHGKR